MKKNIALLIIFFVINTLFAKDINKADLIGKSNRFQINETFYFIEFINESEYTFCSPFGGKFLKNYPYYIESNKLILSIPDNSKVFDDDSMNKLMFPNGKKAIFIYEDNSDDFYCVDVFRNDKVTLRNFNHIQQAETECSLDGIKVIKKSGKEYVLSNTNLRLRKKPDLKAPTAGFNYYSYFGTAESLRSGNFSYKGYKVNKIKDYPLLLEGMTATYDAVTVENQTIDGITAPWYRIVLNNHGEESIDETFWVFGGYLSKINDPKNSDYEELLIKTALEKEILSK